jgi:transposase
VKVNEKYEKLETCFDHFIGHIHMSTNKYRAYHNTVRKWVNRYKADGEKGLEELSRRPHNCNCLSEEDRKRIIKSRLQYKPFGARRLKAILNLPYSVKTIGKVLREAGLVKKRRVKAKTKNNLRAVKAKWALFSQIQVDTKHLNDIPEYFGQMISLKLPKYQFTAREVTSGLLFISLAYENTLTNAVSFVDQLAEHLLNNGADLSKTIIQTDNGSEFIGSWNAKKDSKFTERVESYGMTHRTIKPQAHTWQADVETSHNLIEDEFYIVEQFKNVAHLQQKMGTYLLWFNFMRKNSYKENQTPLQMALNKAPDINNDIVSFKPLILDYCNSDDIVYTDHHVGVNPFQ